MFFEILSQNVSRQPFWMTENHFRSQFSHFQINTQLFILGIFFTKWPPASFWMSENHFQLHFSPYQINAQLLFSFNFFYKMATGGHFGRPKITFDHISCPFRSIRNFSFLGKFCTNHFQLHFSPYQINTQLLFSLNFFYKIATGGHFG